MQQMRFVSVLFLVFGAACLALAIVFLLWGAHHTHWRRVLFLAGGGIALVITGGRLLAQAIATSKNPIQGATGKD